MSKKLVIIGASGHGKVIADIALKNGYEVVGFLDDNPFVQEVLGFPVLGKVKDAVKYKETCEFIIAIGSNVIRRKIAETNDVKWATLIHPSAITGIGVHIGEGSVVMANAVINPAANVGQHCIINTGAVIEHDNVLGNYVHVSPNAALAGTVCVGDGTHIGIGACVRNNLKIAGEVVIGAGAVVVKEISEKGTYAGVPARRLK